MSVENLSRFQKVECHERNEIDTNQEIIWQQKLRVNESQACSVSQQRQQQRQKGLFTLSEPEVSHPL